MKKKTIKRLGILSLVSLMVLGGSAWLTNRETAPGTNHIQSGKAAIKFANQANMITLADNNAIPMTKEYAIENSTIYSFDIVNDGTFALDYKISVSPENYAYSGFNADQVNVVIAEVAKDAEPAAKKAALSAADVQKLSSGKELLANTDLLAKGQTGDTVSYVLVAYVDEATANATYVGGSASFKLEVNAEQSLATRQ